MKKFYIAASCLVCALCFSSAFPASARESSRKAPTASVSNKSHDILFLELTQSVTDKKSAAVAASSLKSLMKGITRSYENAEMPVSPELLKTQELWKAIAETHKWFDSRELENAYREAYYEAGRPTQVKRLFPVKPKIFNADFSDLPPFTAKDDAAAWAAMKPALEHIKEQRDFWLSVHDKASADAAAEQVAKLYAKSVEIAQAHEKSIPELEKMEVSEALQSYVFFVRRTLKREVKMQQTVVTRFEKWFGSSILKQKTAEAVEQGYSGIKH